MILSHKEIEEIAAAVTKDFNEFFFGPDTDGRRLPRGTPIDQFAREYMNCMRGNMSMLSYAKQNGLSFSTVKDTRDAIRKKFKKIF